MAHGQTRAACREDTTQEQCVVAGIVGGLNGNYLAFPRSLALLLSVALYII